MVASNSSVAQVGRVLLTRKFFVGPFNPILVHLAHTRITSGAVGVEYVKYVSTFFSLFAIFFCLLVHAILSLIAMS